MIGLGAFTGSPPADLQSSRPFSVSCLKDIREPSELATVLVQSMIFEVGWMDLAAGTNRSEA
jgi:hypothetical protein